ncbi:hypothetical protein ACQ4M3_32070 [Leptolyngbya sp. AN03gr2]|uniref:hypothetical protein n=1 Tax=unclassified Leptolyngbya TaxID=2650499 RepID=UPI003D320651
MMTPKEELIQAVEQSPDNVVQALLELLKVLQSQNSPKAIHSSESVSYPLRGLPIVVAEDFDEPMPELWESLSQ